MNSTGLDSSLSPTPVRIPGLLLEEAGAKASQNITEMTTLATKKRPDTLALSSMGLTWGHDVIQTCPSNKALTGTGCGRPRSSSSAFSGIHSGAADHPGHRSQSPACYSPEAGGHTHTLPPTPAPPKASLCSQWRRTLIECSGGPREQEAQFLCQGSSMEAVCKAAVSDPV